MLNISTMTRCRAALLTTLLSGLLNIPVLAADNQPADPAKKEKQVRDYLERLNNYDLGGRRGLAESMATNAMESLPLYQTSLPLRMEYDPTSTSTPKKMTFKIGPPGKEIFSVEGHDRSIFYTRDDKFFFLRYSPTHSGATFVAYDLKTGKQLWETKLTVLGQDKELIKHILGVYIGASTTVPVILGREDDQTYAELIEETGKILGNKHLRELKSPASSERPKSSLLE